MQQAAPRRHPAGTSRVEGDLSIARPPKDLTPSRDGPRVNEMINVLQVRLIDESGEMIGVLSRNDALNRALDVGLDLVEVSPNADPPVCKILDFGKYKYELQKKKSEQKKKQKVIEIKEIKLRPNIGDNDYNMKMRKVTGFINDGDRVKVTLRFRGREMAHQNLGLDVLKRVQGDVEEIAKIEQFPKMEGRQMVMVLAPR